MSVHMLVSPDENLLGLKFGVFGICFFHNIEVQPLKSCLA